MGKVAVHKGGGGNTELSYVVGTYKGTSTQKNIPLGFRPKAVIIVKFTSESGWTGPPTFCTAILESFNKYGWEPIYDDGFKAGGDWNGTANNFYYIAFR